MASAIAASELQLLVDSIPTVDLRNLSQSQLYTLSLCGSSSSFDAFDFVIPKIDRSVFNESAGSRKQTYSHLRLAPPATLSDTSSGAEGGATSSIRLRRSHLRHSSSNFSHHYLDSDPEKGENEQILSLFNQLFGLDGTLRVHEELVPARVDYSESLPQISSASATGQKRKRGRPQNVENVHVLYPFSNKLVSRDRK